MSDKKYIQSIERASAILEFIAEKKSARLIEICEATNLKKSTAFSIIQTLEHLGQVARTRNSQKYTLGLSSLKLGLAYQYGSGFSETIRELLTRMVKAIDETAYFELEIGGRYYYLDYVLSTQPLRVVPGDDRFIDPPDYSALGQIFKGDNPELKYAVDIEEVEKGLNCFAAPYKINNKVIGCIVLTGPSYRYTEDRMEETYNAYKKIMLDLGLDEHL
ncbi:transcriptional regulator, IclR family protein [Acidaminobacter sp. JC074]|uniref:IclR family transcriptional regulator n=1 Tax=Acidaminobacter sp. JC074 TaxID=2530199 RepID=UPI001F0F610B|nr:helix-turn-helix domain-containing protein [Acidaminobacter sp. JC074]MCH4885995.1 transcriptional regulator, IclR family protein [Acidaminobacter sp. JC074]